MTERNSLLDSIVSDETRRSFLKKSAVATAGVAVTSGGASAQDGDGDGGALTEGWKGLIFIDSFHPNARFTFVSGVSEWVPNYGDVQDSWFSDYNTYQIRWLNTDEVVPLFVAQEANIGEYDEDLGFIPDADDDNNQPQLFEMNQEWTPFGDNERLITVNVSPVGEEEEDQILENEDWWQDGDGEETPQGDDETEPGNATENVTGDATDNVTENETS